MKNIIKVVPVTDCPLHSSILLAKQIWDEIDKSFVIPEHLLKPKKVCTAREISTKMQKNGAKAITTH